MSTAIIVEGWLHWAGSVQVLLRQIIRRVIPNYGVWNNILPRIIWLRASGVETRVHLITPPSIGKPARGGWCFLYKKQGAASHHSFSSPLHQTVSLIRHVQIFCWHEQGLLRVFLAPGPSLEMVLINFQASTQQDSCKVFFFLELCIK